MQKTKILAVAPYEGMSNILTELAQKRDDISLTVQTGDLDIGRQIAVQLAHKNYDVIISRGGTAELIESAVEVPVIDISISVYDVLRSIKLAENYGGKFVIAGFCGITKCAGLLCDLLQYDIDIITFKSTDDALPLLRRAQEEGCTLVLCDMTGAKAAKELGMNCHLILSGAESIENAINEAVKLVRSSSHVHKQKDLFQTLLTEEDREFLIYSPAGALWFSSIAVDEIHISLMDFVEDSLSMLRKHPNQAVAKQIRNDIYYLSSRHLFYEEQKYTAVIIRRQPALTKAEDLGIQVTNYALEEVNDFLHFYNGTEKLGDLPRILKEYSKSRLPVLILGETGTGKDRAAALIYEQSNYRHAPLFTIDCGLMGERKWHRLLNSENSPLNEVGSVIYLKNPAALSAEQLDSLFTYVVQTRLPSRNRLIVSLIENGSNSSSARIVRQFMENQLSCLTLALLPLRERLKEFPDITALYIHRFNIAFGKQIIGLDVEAMEQMTAYRWPNNLDQLQHVLKELVTITETPYISSSDVTAILQQEPGFGAASAGEFDLSGTLDEINYRIIRQALAEEQGNKEKTARRLGISRSTLWRILKNHTF